jgi:hypothetical protein
MTYNIALTRKKLGFRAPFKVSSGFVRLSKYHQPLNVFQSPPLDSE